MMIDKLQLHAATEHFFFLIIYLFIYGCAGSSFLCEGFLQLWQAGATPHRGARASHYRGPSRCGAQAPDAQAQQLWLTGPVAPRHAGSSQTRARTRVPRIGRQTLNHCATREAPEHFFRAQKQIKIKHILRHKYTSEFFFFLSKSIRNRFSLFLGQADSI